MVPTEVAQRVADRQLGDPDVDFRVDALVIRVVIDDGSEGDFVENSEHGGRRVEEEVGKDRFRIGQVDVGDLERFRVIWIRGWKNCERARRDDSLQTHFRRGCECVDRRLKRHGYQHGS